MDVGLSAAEGTYATYGAVPTGSYYVGAFDVTGEFISEVYLDTPCVGCVPTIGTAGSVTAGADTSGVDFSLVPSGRIAGTVTIEDWGDPLNGGVVHVFDSIGNEIGGGSPWGGAYQTLGLPTGTYYAAAVGPTAGVGLQSELFDDMACPFASCSPITGTAIGVTAPGTTTNVDFDLPLGARIAGFVQDAAGGVPLFNMTVDVFDSAGTFGVQSPGDVDSRASVQIILTDGFFVESGAAATFEIDPALLP